MKPLRLKKDAERRIKAGHLWIFSNDIDVAHSPLKNYTPGEIIIIETAFGKSVAIGYINPHCLLCIRILTCNIHEKIDVDFFIRKINNARAKRMTLFSAPFYRAVFGESDRLPGLVIDQFNDIVVVQLNTAGMELLKPLLLDAIQAVFQPKTLLLKCDSTERNHEGLDHYAQIIGDPLPEYVEIQENNMRYDVSLHAAQKTGWFFDHRFNRQRIATYCNNKRVLDAFSYCGAFGLLCAKQGAREVIAIDRSQSALDLLQHNAKRDALHTVKTMCGDALTLMQDFIAKKEKFDVVILDPPALIKRKKDIPAGEKMYQKLNEAAFALLADNGILLSASCSMHLSHAALLNCIRKAAIQTHKEIIVLEQCHQGPDHPIHPAITETDYLKGFIVGV